MATAASAQSVMEPCGEQWQAAKQEDTTNRETWPQFLKKCPPRPPVARAKAHVISATECEAEYASNWPAIGRTKREFVAACLAGK
jgi:hypothetical protein